MITIQLPRFQGFGALGAMFGALLMSAVGIWYLVLLSRGTVATRYANK